MNIIFLQQNTKNVSEGSLASVCSSKTVGILKLCTVVVISNVQGHHTGLPHHGMDVTGQVPGQLCLNINQLYHWLAGWLVTMQLLATDSNNCCISGLAPNS